MAELAVVTGASSGLGVEFARIHASRGGDLVLVARREDRLRELAEELVAAHGVEVDVVARDLAVPGAPEDLAEDLLGRGVRVDTLINNAGFGGHGVFTDREWERDRDMIRLNIEALTALTRKFLPPMVERGGGRVLNVASTAGFLPGPLQAVYFATKAYVISFSEAVNEELKGTGVTVSVLCPGATQTEFFDSAGLGGTRFLKFGVASSRKVAEFGYRAMSRGRRVAVPGFANRFMMHSLRLTPRWLATRLSKAAMEKF